MSKVVFFCMAFILNFLVTCIYIYFIYLYIVSTEYLIDYVCVVFCCVSLGPSS